MRAGEKAALVPRPHIQMKTCALCSFAFLVKYVLSIYLYVHIRSRRNNKWYGIVIMDVNRRSRRVLSAVSPIADASFSAYNSPVILSLFLVPGRQEAGRRAGKGKLGNGSLQHPLWVRHARTHTPRGPGSHRPHLPPSIPSSFPPLLSLSLPRPPFPASAGEAGICIRKGPEQGIIAHSARCLPGIAGAAHPIQWATHAPWHTDARARPVLQGPHSAWQPLSHAASDWEKKNSKAEEWAQRKQPSFRSQHLLRTPTAPGSSECEGPKLAYRMLMFPHATSPSHS